MPRSEPKARKAQIAVRSEDTSGAQGEGQSQGRGERKEPRAKAPCFFDVFSQPDDGRRGSCAWQVHRPDPLALQPRKLEDSLKEL